MNGHGAGTGGVKSNVLMHNKESLQASMCTHGSYITALKSLARSRTAFLAQWLTTYATNKHGLNVCDYNVTALGMP